MYCGNCGKSFKKENNFCPYCGAKNDFIRIEEDVQASIKIEKEQHMQPREFTQLEPKKKLEKWKKIVIAVACVVAMALIATLSYYATCFFTGKAYRVERDSEGNCTEYHFGKKISESWEVCRNGRNQILYTLIKEKKTVDDEVYKIETKLTYIYDENNQLSYKSGMVNGEPGVYKHTYTLDVDDNYMSDETWYPGDKEGEYIIKDTANQLEIKRIYEEYKTENTDYLINSSKLCLLRGGGLKTDGSSYSFVTRLVNEEYIDEKEPDNSYTSTFEYKDEIIVEKQVDNDGTYIIEYDLTGEMINGYWE